MAINILRNILSIAVLGIAFIAPPAQAETNMRCGDKIIGSSDSMASIVAKCGEPSSVQHFTEPARYRNRWGEWVIDRNSVGTEITEWVYNFGRDKLMMQLRFSNGELQDVRTLGYGH